MKLEAPWTDWRRDHLGRYLVREVPSSSSTSATGTGIGGLGLRGNTLPDAQPDQGASQYHGGRPCRRDSGPPVETP